MREHSDELGAIAQRWFEVMRDCGDDVRELLHDGHPTACVGDAAFAYVNAFKAHVNVGFFRGAEIADPERLLEGTGKFMRHVKLGPEREVDATALMKLIETAYTDMKGRTNAESVRAATSSERVNAPVRPLPCGERLRYSTKIDTWIVVLLAGAVTLPIAIAIVGYLRIGPSPAVWLPLLIAAMMIFIICIVAVPTRYEVTPDQLVIRSGLLHWEVPMAEIVSVTPTSNPLSSPAWSLERLEVKWIRAGRTRSILISPQRTQDFLRDVADRDRTLVIADGRLRRSE